MIPKLIHHVWVGAKPFPAEARGFIETWKRLNPDFRVIEWNESNIDFSPRFIRQAYGVRAYNRVANYVRMAALFTHGGIYMDHDVELLQPLDALLHNECFAGFQTRRADARDVVNNAVVGAVPGHPFIGDVLGALDRMNGAMDVGSGSGPGLFSRILRQGGSLPIEDHPVVVRGVTLYPPRYFYPYEWDEPFDPACITPDTVGVHRWAHTWGKPRPGRLRKIRNRLKAKLVGLFPTAASHAVRLDNVTVEI
jgi:mannosyltransferase OCH1-like enzyme